MRVLSFDPGGERCGWAVLDDYPSLVDSGIYGLNRDRKIPYQAHRLLLIDYWVPIMQDLLDFYNPQIVVNETVPSPKGENYGRLAQMNLAATVITTIQTLAICAKLRVIQIGANTVKKTITGNKDATKVRVRNGVYEHFPETKGNPEWSKVFDESDAIAVGLTYLMTQG